MGAGKQKGQLEPRESDAVKTKLDAADTGSLQQIHAPRIESYLPRYS